VEKIVESMLIEALKPIQDKLAGHDLVLAKQDKALALAHEWQLSLFANGSGRPPGFFDVRVKADDAWRKEIREKLEKQEELGVHVEEMRKLLAAQLARSEEKKARNSKVAWWFAGVTGSVLSAALIFAGSQLYKVASIMWDSYRKVDPTAVKRLDSELKHPIDPAAPVVAPQQSDLPSTYDRNRR
jgi:hypothetical protein